jgi:hypothetical protein
MTGKWGSAPLGMRSPARLAGCTEPLLAGGRGQLRLDIGIAAASSVAPAAAQTCAKIAFNVALGRSAAEALAASR